MADILCDGLPVLDLLEITPSTSVVAEITQRDQSSISRIYRQVSRRLGLDFRKQHDGLYRADANQVLLEGLRRSSQWMRLQADPPEPRWLACSHAGLVTAALEPTLLQRCGDPQRLASLILQRVLDLAVISRSEPTTLAHTPELLELPLLCHPSGIDLIALRRDLQEHPALQALISAVRCSYRQHLEQHPDLEWLD